MSAGTPRPSLRAYRPVEIDNLVRIGRQFDGGYVVPRSLAEGSTTLLSLGVNDDWSFEEGVLALNPAVRVLCVDGSTGLGHLLKKSGQKAVDMIGYLLSLQFGRLARNARYLAKPLAFRRFFSQHELLGKMVVPQPTPGAVTLTELLRRDQGDSPGSTILKIDIEGAEYEVLLASLQALGGVSLILVEFHDLGSNWIAFEVCMQSLMADFHVAHMHGNNFAGYIPGTRVPGALEVTLVRKSLVPGDPLPALRDYPRPGLDMPNRYGHPDLAIDFN
jgi:hypothetical protein